ncbi:MAG: class I SAM-dependent methyltransferase [Bacteroidetes bacterium]|nr:MAG: class I SAM-dependent methyltransferase [Bacteroidota bacterium]
MQYDPIKNVIGDVAKRTPVLRKFFYWLLGVMFLRTWYVKRALRELLAKHTGPFALFDAGTGFGQYSYYIASRWPNASIHAIDVKEDYIADCRAFFRAEGLSSVGFAVEDLTVPAHRERFDVILSVDVMEHIADDVTVFRNFFAAMKSGGRLLIHTPSNLGGSDVHKEGDTSFVEEHARDGYSVEDITAKLTGAGFRMLYTRYSYGPVGTLSWRLVVKYPLLMLNASKLFFLLLPFYYLLTLWFSLLLMWVDYRSANAEGTGLLVAAEKP